MPFENQNDITSEEILIAKNLFNLNNKEQNVYLNCNQQRRDIHANSKFYGYGLYNNMNFAINNES